MKAWVRADVLAKEVCGRVLKFPDVGGKHSLLD